ncbi:hypothetical protein BDZ97DRAFT_1876228 [Flammula alnicola]|nr:hypothetical protein BDZ97DRAFT_1876228 [Flammula alnicola]
MRCMSSERISCVLYLYRLCSPCLQDIQAHGWWWWICGLELQVCLVLITACIPANCTS